MILWEEVWHIGGAAGSIHEEAALVRARLICSRPLRPILQLQHPHSLHCVVPSRINLQLTFCLVYHFPF
jgi:hypothetical protein